MVTNVELNNLKWKIIQSYDGNDISKKVLLFLIDHSQKLTKNIRLILSVKDGFSEREVEDIFNGIHSMLHSRHGLSLYEYLSEELKCDMRFDETFGYSEDGTDDEGPMDSQKLTIWLGNDYRSSTKPKPEQIKIDSSEIIRNYELVAVPT